MVSAKSKMREAEFTIKQGEAERRGTDKLAHKLDLKIKKEVGVGLVNVGPLLA